MTDVVTNQNQIQQQQQKTETQRENWVTKIDLRKVWDTLAQQAIFLYKTTRKGILMPTTCKNSEFRYSRRCMSGLFFPSRRSLD